MFDTVGSGATRAKVELQWVKTMGISVNRKQITTLAKTFDVPGLSYLQKMDLIASALGFNNQAALMATLNNDRPAAQETNALTLQDWRAPQDVCRGDVPIREPITVAIEATAEHIDVFIGGAKEDPYGRQASSLRIEREGGVTRYMINDSQCDAPRVIGVPDGASMRELAHDWEPVKQQSDPHDLIAWADGSWCYREELEEYGRDKSDDFAVVRWGDYVSGEEDEAAIAAHRMPGAADLSMTP